LPQNGDGRTPLAHAVAAGSAAIVQTLLERGVDPNARDRHGRTPLSDALALPSGKAESLIRLLIRFGASPELAAVNGETPLGLRWRGRNCAAGSTGRSGSCRCGLCAAPTFRQPRLSAIWKR
jgi:hypothetical protein